MKQREVARLIEGVLSWRTRMLMKLKQYNTLLIVKFTALLESLNGDNYKAIYIYIYISCNFFCLKGKFCHINRGMHGPKGQIYLMVIYQCKELKNEPVPQILGIWSYLCHSRERIYNLFEVHLILVCLCILEQRSAFHCNS